MTSLGQRLGALRSELGIEDEPFCIALRGGDLPLTSYVGWLRSVATIIGALEETLAACADARVSRAHASVESRLPPLRRDVAHFDDELVPATRALAPTIALSEAVRRWGQVAPQRLLGAFHAAHVMGSPAMTQATVRCYGLDDEGAAFLASHDEAAPAAIAEVLETCSADEVLAGARSFFEQMREVARPLHPLEDTDYVAALALNDEAGHYLVTSDPREMLAAIDAGVKTWEEFPYYPSRYGARGRKFTRSDSAWLVTLVEMEPDIATRQLRWIAGLLASRGMPTLLLERHLLALHEALVRAVPERAERYERLRELAEALGRRRQMLLDPREFDALAASFERETPIANLGPVIVAAMQDDRLGYAHALDSVYGWLVDEERFDHDLGQAVRRLVVRTREALGEEE